MADKQLTKKNGKFIVIEGLDGSGKSTHVRLLADYLRGKNLKVHESFEPTQGPIGSVIRQIIMGRFEVDPRTLSALFAADRLDHIFNKVNGVLKHLKEGKIEVCDRYDLTSYAYQTCFVDEGWVFSLNSQAIRPDLTILLDVAAEECYRRLHASRRHPDLFHKLEHLRDARARYLSAIDVLRKHDRIHVIDANRGRATVESEVRQVVDRFLANKDDQ